MLREVKKNRICVAIPLDKQATQVPEGSFIFLLICPRRISTQLQTDAHLGTNFNEEVFLQVYLQNLVA